MLLTRLQSSALDDIQRWLSEAEGAETYRLFGFAGSGKTSLAKVVADGFSGHTIFAAPTGKAAHVLIEKGCLGARTIHSLIYQPTSKSLAILREMQRKYQELPEGREREILRRQIELEKENVKSPSFSLNKHSDLSSADLLILDEASMVNSQVAEDLLSFGVPILALGDPAQLPPVRGQGFFMDAEPNVLLTEVRRQAEGSPILQLATAVREGRGLDDAPEGMVVPKGTFSVQDLLQFDQILVGRNRTRRILNNAIRKAKGFHKNLPESGDKIICLRNDYELDLLNGSQWTVQDAYWDDEVDLTLRLQCMDSGREVVACAHSEYFLGREPAFYNVREKQCFDFAYAITVHKSQGSSWDNVCIVDESRTFGSDARKHLYTAITRAKRELTIIR